MRPHRRLMDPSTLETLIMLRFNRDLWDEKDVDTVMSRDAATDVDRMLTQTPVSGSFFRQKYFVIVDTGRLSRKDQS